MRENAISAIQRQAIVVSADTGRTSTRKRTNRRMNMANRSTSTKAAPEFPSDSILAKKWNWPYKNTARKTIPARIWIPRWRLSPSICMNDTSVKIQTGSPTGRAKAKNWSNPQRAAPIIILYVTPSEEVHEPYG
jgi:hypothetical protein